MRRWILLRHGESEANAAGRLAGHRDERLTARGEAQARAAGEALAGEELALAVTSDLRRATATARILLERRAELRGEPALPVEVRPALRERDTGAWSGEDRERLRAEGRMRWLTDWERAPPGGESLGALAARVIPELARVEEEVELRGSEGAVLIVAHGGVLRVTLGLLEGRERATIGFFGVPNAEPSHLHLSVNRFRTLARAFFNEPV